jgi:hypothetical protein
MYKEPIILHIAQRNVLGQTAVSICEVLRTFQVLAVGWAEPKVTSFWFHQPTSNPLKMRKELLPVTPGNFHILKLLFSPEHFNGLCRSQTFKIYSEFVVSVLLTVVHVKGKR